MIRLTSDATANIPPGLKRDRNAGFSRQQPCANSGSTYVVNHERETN